MFSMNRVSSRDKKLFLLNGKWYNTLNVGSVVMGI